MAVFDFKSLYISQNCKFGRGWQMQFVDERSSEMALLHAPNMRISAFFFRFSFYFGYFFIVRLFLRENSFQFLPKISWKKKNCCRVTIWSENLELPENLTAFGKNQSNVWEFHENGKSQGILVVWNECCGIFFQDSSILLKFLSHFVSNLFHN